VKVSVNGLPAKNSRAHRSWGDQSRDLGKYNWQRHSAQRHREPALQRRRGLEVNRQLWSRWFAASFVWKSTLPWTALTRCAETCASTLVKMSRVRLRLQAGSGEPRTLLGLVVGWGLDF